MTPSFFKNLGPFSAESIFTTIDCKPLNIEKDYSFKELVGIFKNSNNSISFIYDNENNNFFYRFAFNSKEELQKYKKSIEDREFILNIKSDFQA